MDIGREKIMRKEITEFIANCNENTPIDKLKDICESEKELNEVLTVCLSLIENHSASDDEIPLKWKKAALMEFENVPKEKITSAMIQKKFGISYHISWRLRDWLIKVK